MFTDGISHPQHAQSPLATPSLKGTRTECSVNEDRMTEISQPHAQLGEIANTYSLPVRLRDVSVSQLMESLGVSSDTTLREFLRRLGESLVAAKPLVDEPDWEEKLPLVELIEHSLSQDASKMMLVDSPHAPAPQFPTSDPVILVSVSDVVDSGYPRDSHKFEIMWCSPRLQTVESCESILCGLCITRELNQNATKQVLCADLIGGYVKRTWGEMGEQIISHFLHALSSVISHPNTVFSKRVNVGQSVSMLHIVATFNLLTIASVVNSNWEMVQDCVIWFEQAIGDYANESALTIRTYEQFSRIEHPVSKLVEDTPGRSQALKSAPENIGPRHTIFRLSTEDIDCQQPPYNLCWSKLFEEVTIVDRPTARCDHIGVGLRVRFDLMMKMAAVERAVKYRAENYEGVVLTGYMTLLFPVRVYEDGSIQWHVVVKDTLETGHSMLTDLRENLGGYQPLKIDIPSPDTVGYLGWCLKPKLTLGTREVTPYISRSALRSTEDLYRPLERIRQIPMAISVSAFGNMVGLLAGFTPGSTFPPTGTHRPRLRKALSNKYIERVRQMYNESVVVYDPKKKKAWLVPKINLILYIIRKMLSKTYPTYSLEMRYPESRDWIWARDEMLRLQHVSITGSTSERLEFGHLFNEYAEDLQFGLHQTQEVETSSTNNLYAIELADLANRTENRLKVLSRSSDGIKNWQLLLSGQGIIVCPDCDDAIIPTPGTDICAMALTNTRCVSGLFCVISILKEYLETGGCRNWESHETCGYIEKNGRWRWILTGQPFAVVLHEGECTVECFRRKIQVLQHRDIASVCWKSTRDYLSNRTNGTTRAEFMLGEDNLEDGICFAGMVKATDRER